MGKDSMVTNVERRRVQQKRTKGWRMPANTVYVGRPTKWGNPHKVTEPYMLKRSIEAYEHMLLGYSPEELGDFLRPLKGKRLSCWCPLDKPCHVDILIEFLKKANW